MEGILSDSTLYCSALYFAIQHGHIDIVKFLSGLPLNSKRSEIINSTTSYIAAHHGHLDLIKFVSEIESTKTTPEDKVYYCDTKTQSDVYDKTDTARNFLNATEPNRDGVNLEKCNISNEDNNAEIEIIVSNHDDGAVIQTAHELKCSNVSNEAERECLDVTFLQSDTEEVAKSVFGAIKLGNARGFSEAGRDLKNIDIRDVSNNTLLHHAITNGCTRIAKTILKRGADLESINDNEESALHLAIKHGRFVIMKELIKAGALFDARDKWGNTPLHVAANNGNKDVLLMLLKNGAQLDALNDNQETAMMCASSAEVLKELLCRGCDINWADNDNNGIIHCAAKYNHANIIDVLLEQRVSFDSANRHGNTALHLAVVHDHMEVFVKLLDCGVDVRRKNIYGKTAMHIAADENREGMMEVFLERGGSLEEKEARSERTALHCAARFGNEPIIRLLMKKQADVEAVDHLKRTPLHYTAGNGYYGATKLLICGKADLEAKDFTKWTPLHLAVMNGHEDVVKVLINNGADVTAKDMQSNTPQDLAKQRGRDSILVLLQQRV